MEETPEAKPDRLPRFYMVRAVNGTHPPVARHKNLAKAMAEAVRLSEKIGTSCTVLQSFATVHVVDGKPVWTDAKPGV